VTSTWLIAIPCALVGAACFGVAGVLQHQATQQAPPEKPLRPGLLVSLMQMSGFRVGVLLGIAGFVLQVLALRFAPLILVQPLLITDVLFYLGFAALRSHHPPDRRMQGGALLALLGLAGFLIAAGPSSGQDTFDSAAALPLGIGLVVLISICLAAASRLRDEIRALPLALATAICYGVTAGLTRSLVATTAVGPIWTHWELYAVIVVGPAGFLLNQNAYQSGVLGSLALTTITIGDPLVAIGVGVAWLGESIAGGWAILGEVAALGVMGLGIFLLATRAQQISDRIRAGQQPWGA
jgi:drug/metabolite transporter (DMT)-like permease